MKTFQIVIEGITPLLMNQFSDAAQLAATNGTSSAHVGESSTPQEDAASRIYRDSDNDPCIPQPNILRCIMDAGKFHKSGRSKVTTQKSSLIPAAVDIQGESVKVAHEQPWTVDTRPVRIPATGGRILRHRPKFDDWWLKFELTLDTDIISAKQLRDIIDDAGLRIGLGDFRPDTKGPYGKFKVVMWSVEE